MLKICFIGLGSIGQRHLRNLVELLNEKGVFYHIDALRESDRCLPKAVEAYIRKEFRRYEELPDDYDIVFITNPTSMHYETLVKMKNKGVNFFVEKPVFHKMNLNFTCDVNQLLYVACPLRYNRVIQYIKHFLHGKTVYSVHVVSSSYLPDWRPESDYRNSYSAKKKLGGGVEIDLIHEMDYITYLFGFPKEVKSIKGKISELQIETNDIADYILDYGDKIVTIHLDYLSKVARRKVEIITDEDIITGDLIKGTVSFAQSRDEVNFSEARDTYQKRELEAFLDMAAGEEENFNPVERAQKTLELALSDEWKEMK